MKLGVLWLSLVCAGVGVAAQSPKPASGQDAASQLGRGWTALGNRQPAQAIELAQQILRIEPGEPRRALPGLAAQTVSGQPVQALDVYDGWVSASKHEDLFLLQPVAFGVLRQLADQQGAARQVRGPRRAG